jgi:hypothetical protein
MLTGMESSDGEPYLSIFSGIDSENTSTPLQPLGSILLDMGLPSILLYTATLTSIKDNTPLSSVSVPISPEGNVPQDNVPQDNVPQDNVPQDNVPQDNVPQDNVPEDNVPQENFPEDNGPQYNLVAPIETDYLTSNRWATHPLYTTDRFMHSISPPVEFLPSPNGNNLCMINTQN